MVNFRKITLFLSRNKSIMLEHSQKIIIYLGILWVIIENMIRIIIDIGIASTTPIPRYRFCNIDSFSQRFSNKNNLLL